MLPVPVPGPPAPPHGNSIKTRCYVFAIGLVYTVAAYVSNSTHTHSQLMCYMPGLVTLYASVVDEHDMYKIPYFLNILIMIYTYFVSAVTPMEIVYYTYISPNSSYDLDPMWLFVWLGMAFFSSWARKVLWSAWIAGVHEHLD